MDIKMNRCIVNTTERLIFSKWSGDDLPLAETLWGNSDVTGFISASGTFTKDEIEDRLKLEIGNDSAFGIQYWPIFLKDGRFVGCCGLRPHNEEAELGFHLLPAFWHRGYAKEAAEAVILYAFGALGFRTVFAGHNPLNIASKKTLESLGFKYSHDEYYAPTGLMHPSYIYRSEWLRKDIL